MLHLDVACIGNYKTLKSFHSFVPDFISLLMPSVELNDVRNRILTAAHELFTRYGIRSISMDDIASQLSISKKTIYKHFAEKDKMVQACCTNEFHEHLFRLETIKKNSRDAVHECIEMMNYLSGFFSRMNPNMFYDLQKYHPHSWKAFRAFKEQKIMSIVEENLKRGIREGYYRKDINIKILARLRVEEVEMGFNTQLFSHSKFSLGEIQLTLLDHFMHGITTLKGHKLINKYKQIAEEE